MYFYVEYEYTEEQRLEKNGELLEWDELLLEQIEIHEKYLYVVMDQYIVRDGRNFRINPT
jgi:hypothetical protein